MIRLLQLPAVFLTMVAMVRAARAHRQAIGAADRWSARRTLLVSLGILAAVVPGLLAPGTSWIQLTGCGISVLFSAASLSLGRPSRAAID